MTNTPVKRLPPRRPATAATAPVVEGNASGPTVAARQHLLETMLDQFPDYVFAKDRQGRILYGNRVTIEDAGFDHADELIGKTDIELYPGEISTMIHALEQDLMERGISSLDSEEPSISHHGGARWLTVSRAPLRASDGEVIGLVGIARDITTRKRAERQLIGQAALLEMVAKGGSLDTLFQALFGFFKEYHPHVIPSVLFMAPDGQHLTVGPEAGLHPDYVRAIDGIEIGPAVGSCGTAAYTGEPVFVADTLTDPLWEPFRFAPLTYGFRACWSMPMRSHHGEVLGTFALYSPTAGLPDRKQIDLITFAANLAAIAIMRKKAEEKIRHMALHDPLTGLANRQYFDERIGDIIEAAAAGGTMVACAFLDIDNFKMINDSLGHKAGDQLLRTIASRAKARVHASDLVVRLGGDEFIILLSDLAMDPAAAAARLEAIRVSMSAPVTLDGRTLQVTCSMGMACYPLHGRTADELLANADVAMYRAKDNGRNNLQLFTQEIDTRTLSRLSRREELREALATNQLFLEYQPQICLESGEIKAAEALVRWRHPEHGIVPPSDFIPLAEEAGLIGELGEWVLIEACRQNRAWQAAGLKPITIGVNVSAPQFAAADWVLRVAEVLGETGLDARYLELELTESLIMQDVARAIDTMCALEDLGVGLAIDDFGTGYSSLAALKRFPVDRLKIDRSFIADIPGDRDGEAIASAIVSLAHALEIDVIAEGVETQEQLAFLRGIGCQQIQGYLVGRPMAADALAARLATAPAGRSPV
ncbi:PAS domain S-box-containing protein/diguanylate cyclase (GGDEF) domain-containing protein [Rhizobium sp. RU20A]|uniref:EAL domain-containing protein n=1 Tax=Rhizobium sp. RU20A TaxID=1907412 RepID=UPI0009548507|nr:EAL domain-containing protein [Rhizobium sp. RU20A]SIR17643.1 PAS domain S-box-containing protein/diguanylate cyclase (GGDEF) domain-containing protein [Rhizobium sp. RU20A]